MKATATITSGFTSTVSNGRGHEFITDLPKDMNGTDLGAMALEATVMSLAGCITTIFTMIAEKSRVSISGIDVEIDATKGEKTIEKIKADVKVKTEAPEKKVQKVLDKTMEMCPVGLIFEKAGIEIDLNLFCS